MNNPANVRLPVKAKTIDTQPDNAFINVMVFGTNDKIFFCAMSL